MGHKIVNYTLEDHHISKIAAHADELLAGDYEQLSTFYYQMFGKAPTNLDLQAFRVLVANIRAKENGEPMPNEVRQPSLRLVVGGKGNSNGDKHP